MSAEFKCLNCKQELNLIDDEEWVTPDGRIFCEATDETHTRTNA